MDVNPSVLHSLSVSLHFDNNPPAGFAGWMWLQLVEYPRHQSVLGPQLFRIYRNELEKGVECKISKSMILKQVGSLLPMSLLVEEVTDLGSAIGVS